MGRTTRAAHRDSIDDQATEHLAQPTGKVAATGSSLQQGGLVQWLQAAQAKYQEVSTGGEHT